MYYDSGRALKLDCDAPQYGVGAVLSNVMDNGEERPIAFVSRSLTKSETNYAQLEKEALALIFGVKSSTNICMALHSRYRSSPVSHNSGTDQGRPTTSSWPNAALGFDSAGILIMMSNIVQGVSIVKQMLCLACHANIQIAQKRKSSSSRV